MQRKLAGYFLLSFLSFWVFTGIFHTVANAQVPLIQGQTNAAPTNAPTPTLFIQQQTTPKKTTTATQSQPPLPTPTMFTAAPQQVLAASTQTSPQTQEKAVVTPQVTIAPTAIPTPTATPLPQPTIAVVTDLESLFSKYASAYGVDVELLKKIARCESGFNATSNNSGMYLGMFQFGAQTWITTRAAMGMDTNPDLRTNAEEAIKTAAYKIANGGAGAWPNCH